MTLLDFFEKCMSSVKEVIVNGEKAEYSHWENSGAQEEYLLKLFGDEIDLSKTKIDSFSIYEYSVFENGFGIAFRIKDIVWRNK